MKAKWQALSKWQRVLLLGQMVLAALFLILYATIGRQQVISYSDALLRCEAQGDTTTYTGKLNGYRAVWTISPGPVAEFQYGDTLYGPYSITEDPAALPERVSDDFVSLDDLTGVEIREGDQVMFRGGYALLGDSYLWLVSQDGNRVGSPAIYFTTGDERLDAAPSVSAVLLMALDPGPTQRGHWGLFLVGVLACLLCAGSIWFADELFRWNLRFLIQNAQDAQPTDWQLAGRWISWFALTILALAFFLMGLNLG
jgi:hypothetical protein